MNLLTVLAEIEKVDPEVYERLDSRRHVFKHMAGVGQKLTAAALPLFVGAVFNKVYAQTPIGAAITAVLNVALKFEYLELYFYQQRTTVSGLSSANSAAFTRIAADEANHVAFLRTTITSAGLAPIADPTAATFDFSGARISSSNTTGPFGNWRTNANIYLALAQTFEDLGVRAYKNVITSLAPLANKSVLTAALGIHGVEARHSARIRAMRRAGANSTTPALGVAVAPYDAAPKSWISGTDNGGPAASYTAPVYGAGSSGVVAGVSFPAENNTSQAGLNLAGGALPNTATFPAAAFSEAFDEGLDANTAALIARQFTVASSTFFG